MNQLTCIEMDINLLAVLLDWDGDAWQRRGTVRHVIASTWFVINAGSGRGAGQRHAFVSHVHGCGSTPCARAVEHAVSGRQVGLRPASAQRHVSSFLLFPSPQPAPPHASQHQLSRLAQFDADVRRVAQDFHGAYIARLTFCHGCRICSAVQSGGCALRHTVLFDTTLGYWRCLLLADVHARQFAQRSRIGAPAALCWLSLLI